MTAINILKAHLALNVKNVENSIDFYKKMLGIEPSKVRTGYAKFDVQNPPLNLTLNQMAFEGSGALSHLGIQVATTEDVIALREQWRENGLTPREEMQTECCFALQDKAWVDDPDGNEWEVFVVLRDNLPETSERTVGCCVSEPVGIGGITKAAASACGCETTAPAAGEAACCDTQAAKSGGEVKAEGGCCA
jgi:catechol 2,3-dioxygenase-like lactoylglutathione lyase family enzyme